MQDKENPFEPLTELSELGFMLYKVSYDAVYVMHK